MKQVAIGFLKMEIEFAKREKYNANARYGMSNALAPQADELFKHFHRQDIDITERINQLEEALDILQKHYSNEITKEVSND